MNEPTKEQIDEVQREMADAMNRRVSEVIRELIYAEPKANHSTFTMTTNVQCRRCGGYVICRCCP